MANETKPTEGSAPPVVGSRLPFERYLPRLLELIRFGSVGVGTAVLYFCLFWLVNLLVVLPAWLVGAICYGPCLVVNYVLHRTFTFRSDHSHGHAGPRFVVIQLGGLLINSAVLWLGTEVLRLSYWPSQLGAIACLALWSYAGQRFWTFAPHG